MSKRIGVINIIVQEFDGVAKVNAILHDSMDVIIGRMGLPYKERGISAVITLVVDATSDEISSLTGKLGKIEGINVKSVMNKR
ncbi:TM1266 family iron-only hydrogenase system putative regulator [Paenibacillus mesotrionivorans]|jgi:putative iron-only hydrogenase system regulator|uniref:TM1266 family iron-only hydrogenase system putative regulator n=1 Tax=Paenibacillus mesotrionivorans TaxID=3160968 RepID=A0ACC7P2F5_9BACL